MNLKHENPISRRFRMICSEDVSGIGGVGKVASGVVFGDGVTVLHWDTVVNSTTAFRSIDDLVSLHGHNGATEIEFIDE